jgi:hypothetical protein
MQVQNFLRDGGTIELLKEKYAIDAKRHPSYNNLVLLKYSQIDSPFSEEIVRECRGLILDEANDWNVVCFSMGKFFNFGEGHAAKIDWTTARVAEKVDGSLCQLFVYDGRWMFATSGSPDGGGNVSDYSFSFNEFFWKTFTHKLPPVDCGKCFWFELTSIFNKIVVVHPEPSITLLGGRDLTTMKELTVEEAHKYFPDCKVAKQFPLTSFDEIIKSYETFSGLKQEGYVVCDGQFNRTKCKHPQYSAAHHLKDALGSRRAIVEIVRNGEIEEVIATLPEYTDILREAKSKFDALVLELESDYDKIKDEETQKSFAMTAVLSRCSSALFALRAKKVPSIKAHLKLINIDNVMRLLGYKTR